MKKPPRKVQVLTLKSIQDRCEIEGKCWLWQQCLNSAGTPISRSNNKRVSVRRETYRLVFGDIPAKMRVIAKCGDQSCVAPACAKAVTGSEFTTWLTRIGRVNNPAHDAAKLRGIRGRGLTKLNMQTAAELRRRVFENEDRDAIAQEFGISRSQVNRVARGAQWRDTTVANASIFTRAA